MVMRTEIRPSGLSRLASSAFVAAFVGAFAFAPLSLCAQTYTALHDFCLKAGCSDGVSPQGLVTDQAGHFYGTTAGGGAYGQGTVFELVPGARNWKAKILHSFCAQQNCTDGEYPNGNLVMDTAGDFYGAALSGSAETGIVYRLVPNAKRTRWKFQILYAFCAQNSCSDGSYPGAGLTYTGQAAGNLYDGTSPLYGTTEQGGAYNQGAVFEIQPKGRKWIESTLYSFCSAGYPCVDGDEPGQLLVAPSQNLFGVVPNGGPNEGGAVFELVPGKGGTWTESTFYGFCPKGGQCPDGDSPNGQLLFDPAGNLYGTTPDGGANLWGVIYKITPAGKETVLYSFCAQNTCTDGGTPYGLLMDSSGNLFGTTAFGGNQWQGGVVFELSGSYKVLYQFCTSSKCRDGENPGGPLVLDASGNLYGAAPNGGKGQGGHGGGVAFELTP